MPRRKNKLADQGEKNTVEGHKMLTREMACDLLMLLEESEILNEEITEQLSEVRLCIAAEMHGRHFWGADCDEYVKLHTAYRDELWTDELYEEVDRLDKKYTFEPAPYEDEEIKSIYEPVDDPGEEEPKELPFT